MHSLGYVVCGIPSLLTINQSRDAQSTSARAPSPPPYICRIPFFCILTACKLKGLICAFGAHMGSRTPPPPLTKFLAAPPPPSRIPGSAPDDVIYFSAKVWSGKQQSRVIRRQRRKVCCVFPPLLRLSTRLT